MSDPGSGIGDWRLAPSRVMHTVRVLFATSSLAARVERAECAMAVAFGELAKARRADALIAPVGGAAAVYGGPGEPFNKLAGLGFAPLDEDVLADVEREFDAREAPLQVEFAALANPDVATRLARRGYHLVNFEHVLGLQLTRAVVDRAAAECETHAANGVRVGRASTADGASWLNAVATGFAHPDVFDGPPSHESVARDALERVFDDFARIPGLVCYLAHRDAAVAGGASLRIIDGLAQLCGAATLPDHRRRGVQSALLRARLVDAARDGCELAIVTTQPASKSQENVQRAGFTLLYARAIMVRQPRA
jgi:ribosomal protein S18 acetylase RimI-like enzyme